MGQKDKGLYGKFKKIQRADETDLYEGDKHYGCQYFVLDVTHDVHAIPALKAYMESAKKDGYELLVKDIQIMIDEVIDESINEMK